MVATTTDYWVNDQCDAPLFVVTAEANKSTASMIPELLDRIRKLAGDRRITVVFDRGGYSPKLFVQILAAGFDILTYRKGRWRKLPRRPTVWEPASSPRVAADLAVAGAIRLG